MSNSPEFSDRSWLIDLTFKFLNNRKLEIAYRLERLQRGVFKDLDDKDILELHRMLEEVNLAINLVKNGEFSSAIPFLLSLIEGLESKNLFFDSEVGDDSEMKNIVNEQVVLVTKMLSKWFLTS
ncbi:MAG: hypothetical protein N2558_04460 [Patescibacteria group bacterium]|nr:hypothetical protein [Patescibacteria group bacterium]